jgi:hypothetical protein
MNKPFKRIYFSNTTIICVYYYKFKILMNSDKFYDMYSKHEPMDTCIPEVGSDAYMSKHSYLTVIFAVNP